MQQPSLDVLMRKVDSKYELALVAGKRGRMLTDEKQPQGDEKQLKPVSIALNEIAEGKLLIVRPFQLSPCHADHAQDVRKASTFSLPICGEALLPKTPAPRIAPPALRLKHG